MPYSAGTAFLQVVPSFLGVEQAIRNELRKIGASLDAEISKGISDGLSHGTEKAADEGAKAGTVYGGAFGESLRKTLDESLKALPKAELKADASQVERTIAEVRGELEAIRTAHTKLEIDDSEALARIAAASARLREMQRATKEPGGLVNLAAARQQADALDALVQQARDFGFKAGDNWGGAFGAQARKHIDDTLRQLPVVTLEADSGDVDKKLVAIRERLAALRDVRIGVDMDAAQFLSKAAELHGEIEALSHEAVDIGTKFNLEAAAAKLDEFAKVTAPQKGAEAGDEAGGKFADTLRARIEAAAKSLPTLSINANSAPADAKLVELKAHLEELGNKRIGIDLDGGEALAQITTLRAALLDLARDRAVDINVRADAGAAGVELAAILELAHRVDESNPKVKVDASDADKAGVSMRQLAATFNLSAGQLVALVALGPAIGAAIVPAALAAAAAVASIGSAVVASVGVAVLGFSGVGAAVKALNAQQQQADKSAASLDTSQNRLAGSLDQVKSAEASLGNTRRTVADAASRSAQQVTDAQRSVADAERNALDAQNALNGAYEEARRQQEDQAAQLQGNAIAQRQSVLDLADAKDKLDAILANPAATAREREQAQVTYDQRKLQLQDLQREGGRLAEDQTKADQAGIEGSKQVVAARGQIRSTNEALGKAQQQLADAEKAQKEQQVQGAFQIAQAAQGVVNAQRSVEQASIRAGVAGGAAMDNLKTAMANLSPEAQQFAKFLFSLKPTLDGLRAAASTALLPGVEDGIKALLPVVPQLKGDIAGLAGELGNLASETGHSLGSPYWTSFGHMLMQQAIPAMDTAYHVAASFAMGLAGIARSVLPFAGDIGGGLLAFSQRFAAAANHLDENGRFQAVMAYVRTAGPEVVHTLGELVTAVLHLGAAFSPLGSPTLTTLRILATIINDLPLSVLQEVSQAAVLVGLAFKGWDMIKTVKDSELFKDAISALSGVLNSARVSMLVAGSEGAGALGTGLAGVKGAASEAGSKIAALGSSLGAGGVFGLGAAAALLLAQPLVDFFHKEAAITQDVKTKTDGLAASLEGLGRHLREGSQDTDAYINSLIQTDPKFRDFVINAKNLGLGVDTIRSALTGNKAALDEVDAAYDKQINTLQAYLRWVQKEGSDVSHTKDETAAYLEVQKTHPELIGKSSDEVQKYINTITAQKLATDDTTTSLQKEAEALGIVNAATAGLSPGALGLGVALKVLSDSTSTATAKADALKQAEDALFGTVRSVDQATESYAAAEDRLTQSIKENGNSLDINTAAGRANHDAIRDLLKAADDEYQANIRNGMSIDDASKKHDQEVEALRRQAGQMHLNVDKVNELIGVYGQIPTSIDSKLKVSGVQQAFDQLRSFGIAQLMLKYSISEADATSLWSAQNPGSGPKPATLGFAAGGPVRGPGGPTDDLVRAVLAPPGARLPAWAQFRLSDGEHVLTAEEVDRLGGHDAVLALRRAVMDGRIPKPRTRYPGDGSQGLAFAAGGAVTWPFEVSFKGAWPHSVADVVQAQSNTPQGKMAVALRNWAVAQQGKPYIWASSGPAGYDCSGAVGAGWGLAHNKAVNQRYFSTMNEAPFFPIKGVGGVLTAGWTNPGEPGPGGSSVGHTAAVIYAPGGPTPFESRGGDGFVVGPRTTNVRSFAHVGHFAKGGPVGWLMDEGGMLAPGWNPPIFNGTGSPEPVLSPGQWQDIGDLARTGGAGETHHHWTFKDTTLTPGVLRSMQDREAALARVGRAR